MDFEVIYEDNSIIVVNKPQNIPTQADSSGDKDMLTMIKEYIKEKYNKPGNVFIGLVHRLDRPTGGVMVFARNAAVAAELSEKIPHVSLPQSGLCGSGDAGYSPTALLVSMVATIFRVEGFPIRLGFSPRSMACLPQRFQVGRPGP